LLEKNDVTATELHDIMIESRRSNKFFGAKVNACLKDFNSFQQNKFIEEALEAYNRALSYLNTFYDFNGSRLQYFCALNIRKYDLDHNKVSKLLEVLQPGINEIVCAKNNTHNKK
jgi:hypothetical protein